MKLAEVSRVFSAILIVLFAISTFLTGIYAVSNLTTYSLLMVSISSILLGALIVTRPTIMDIHRAYFPKTPVKLDGVVNVVHIPPATGKLIRDE